MDQTTRETASSEPMAPTGGDRGRARVGNGVCPRDRATFAYTDR